jgi:hypothetical protein
MHSTLMIEMRLGGKETQSVIVHHCNAVLDNVQTKAKKY